MNFKRITIILFSIIAFLLSLTLLLFMHLIQEVKNDGTIINIAGRQRMLSQKITKLCMQIDQPFNNINNQNVIPDLKATLILFETSHNELFNSNKELGLFINDSDTIIELYSAIQTNFEEIISSGKNIIDVQKLNPNVLKKMFKNEKEFLFLMNKAVFLFDKENSLDIKKLNNIVTVLIIFIIFILFIELKLVLIPIINKEEKNRKLLIESNKTKDKFFSIIAHDLKAPFNSMLGFSDLLFTEFEKYDTQKQKHFISIIHDKLQSTFKLLENLLYWSHSQKGTISFNPQMENLNILSQETIDTLSLTAINKSISLFNEIPKHIFIDTDKDMFATIIRNLISNAIKFTQKEGVITITAKEIKNKNNTEFAEISVNDNGVGISEEVQSKLFSIAENTTTIGTQYESGSGLGLILCKEFVEKHKGEIWIESEVEKGSRFIFTIPIHKKN